MIEFLIEKANNGEIKLEIEVNGIVYDKDFSVDGPNKLISAKSNNNPKDELVIEVDNLEEWVARKTIRITITSPVTLNDEN